MEDAILLRRHHGVKILPLKIKNTILFSWLFYDPECKPGYFPPKMTVICPVSIPDVPKKKRPAFDLM